MKLRKHREDVADLKLMGDNHVQEIAKRYLNLIRMAEQRLKWSMNHDFGCTIKEKRVLKDAEVKKCIS